MMMKMVMIIIQTTATFVSTSWFLAESNWRGKNIFNHRTTSYFFLKSGFKELTQKIVFNAHGKTEILIWSELIKTSVVEL